MRTNQNIDHQADPSFVGAYCPPPISWDPSAVAPGMEGLNDRWDVYEREYQHGDLACTLALWAIALAATGLIIWLGSINFARLG